MGCSVSIHSCAARGDASALLFDDPKPHPSDAFENTDGSLFARDASDEVDDVDERSTAFTRSQCFTAPGETYDEPPAAMVENEIRFRVARARRVHGITDDPLQFKPPPAPPQRACDAERVAAWLRDVPLPTADTAGGPHQAFGAGAGLLFFEPRELLGYSPGEDACGSPAGCSPGASMALLGLSLAEVPPAMSS